MSDGSERIEDRKLDVLYLVHDVHDAAVKRRVVMLETGGAQVTLAGFRRSDAVSSGREDEPILDLGQTRAGGFADRALKVAARSARLPKSLRALRPDVIVARNLEMLAIAQRVRAHVSPNPIMVYEVLDIHRLLLRADAVGRVLRLIERRLMKTVSLVVTSSPAFVEHYFQTRQDLSKPVLLLENKVLAFRLPSLPGSRVALRAVAASEAGPIRIGWFGVLRCRKSFAILESFASRMGGRYEIVLRGRPAYNEIPDLRERADRHPHMSFFGPYRSPDDLKAIYDEVDFVWAIDFFEEGMNSLWLLPNRLYEGCLFGCVPIAMRGTETARFLKDAGIGVLLDEASVDALSSTLQRTDLTEERGKLGRCLGENEDRFAASEDDCRRLVSSLTRRFPPRARTEIVERL